MRLLSIFALLFLISFMLHRGMKDESALDGSTGLGTDMEEAADGPDALPAVGQDEFASLIFEKPYPIGRFDFEKEYVFSTIQAEIKNLIIGRNDDGFKSSNHFCAVGYDFPRDVQGKRRIPARKETVVYWKEGRVIYRWNGGDPKAVEQDFYNARTMMFSPYGSILLDEAAEEGEPEAQESGETGEISPRARALNLIADCEKHGKVYEIEPFAPPPRGFRRPAENSAPRPAATVPAAPPAAAPAASPPPATHAAPPLPAPSANTPDLPIDPPAAPKPPAPVEAPAPVAPPPPVPMPTASSPVV